MDKQEKIMFGMCCSILLFAFVVVSAGIGPFNSTPKPESSVVTYNAHVDIYKNNELISSASNLLYTSGKNSIKEMLGSSNQNGPFLNISLCNATAGCSSPIADASEAFNLLKGCGFESIEGTYASTGDGKWTVTKTFTSTCDSVEINSTRLTNVTGGNLAGNNFTLATLQNSDTLTINWSLNVTQP